MLAHVAEKGPGMRTEMNQQAHALTKDLPEPFKAEWTGGGGIHMHHKFVVRAHIQRGQQQFGKPAQAQVSTGPGGGVPGGTPWLREAAQREQQRTHVFPDRAQRPNRGDQNAFALKTLGTMDGASVYRLKKVDAWRASLAACRTLPHVGMPRRRAPYPPAAT